MPNKSFLWIVVVSVILLMVGISNALVIETTESVDSLDIYGHYLVWQQYFPVGRYNIWVYDFNNNFSYCIANTPDKDLNPRVFGDIVVWESFYNPWDKNSMHNGEIFGYNLKKYNLLEIAVSNKVERCPDIYGDLVSYIENDTTLVIYNISTENIVSCYNFSANFANGEISIARLFGSYVVFIGGYYNNGAYYVDVFVYDIQNGSVKQITNDSNSERYPVIWGYDVYWVDADNEIYRYNIIDGKVYKLTNDGGSKYFLDVWGENIVYNGFDSSGIVQVYLFNTYLRKTVQLTFDVPSHWKPVIYGNIVAYYDGWNYDIYVLNISTVAPEFADNDMDGLCNAHEIYIGTNPNAADSDNDGYNDYIEFMLNTDPLNPSSHPNNGEAGGGVNVIYADSDGDGLTDYQEISLGLDPKDVQSNLDNNDTYLDLYIPYIKLNENKISLLTNSEFPDLIATKIIPNSTVYIKLHIKAINSSFIENLKLTMLCDDFKEDLQYSVSGAFAQSQVYLENIDTSKICLIRVLDLTSGKLDEILLYLYMNEDEDHDGLNVSEEMKLGIFPFLNDSDGDGLNDSVDPYPLDPTNGNVSNQPPVATFSFKPDIPVIGGVVAFNASESYDPDGNISEYLWDFGDGTTAYGKIVEHVFNSSGMYTVALTVVDDKGMKNTTVKTVQVSLVKRILPKYVYPNSTFNVTLKVISNVVMDIGLSEVVPSEFEIVNGSVVSPNSENISIKIAGSTITISMLGKVDNITYTLKAPPSVGVYSFKGYIETFGQNTAGALKIPIGGDTRIEVVNNQPSPDELKKKILADILEYMRNPSEELKQQILNEILEYINLIRNQHN